MPRYLGATGRRKTAVAVVRLLPGKGEHVINGKPLNDYFPLDAWRERALAPLALISQQDRHTVSAKVTSGGLSAQAEAVRLGVARALLSGDEELKTSLKTAGFLTRDARTKERRKYGLKKARKAPQFSKR
jgi:small subunit ribosomal protein S9